MGQARRFPISLALAALFFALAHLALEHFTGGVRSHNLLNRADLPTISNWFGLLTLPLLGIVLGLRLRAHSGIAQPSGMPISILAAFAGALLYGAALAVSFELGASAVTSAALLGLFLCALALPIYRAEYIAGFVVGMTITFGGVLPLLVAAVFAAMSFAVRYTVRLLASLVRRKRSGSGAP